jgi:predicted RNA-binding protein
MNFILFVTNTENFATTTEKGIVGFKAGRKNYALKTRPGDQLAFYIAGTGKVGGIVKIESEMYEDREKLFKPKTPGEIYPWRFKSSNILVLPEEKWIPIEHFRDKLEIFKARPGPHWKLALQGQIHYLTSEDFQTVQEELEKEKA